MNRDLSLHLDQLGKILRLSSPCIQALHSLHLLRVDGLCNVVGFYSLDSVTLHGKEDFTDVNKITNQLTLA